MFASFDALIQNTYKYFTWDLLWDKLFICSKMAYFSLDVNLHDKSVQ